MEGEFSLIRFCVTNFWAVLISSRPFQPISTLLMKLVEALISSEEEPDKEVVKRLKWIYENTHEKVNVNLSIIELVVFKNLDKGLNKEIDIGDKTFMLIELYKYLDEVSKELAVIVIKTAKKYNLEIPVGLYSQNRGSQSINVE